VTSDARSPAYQSSDCELRMLGAILFQSIRDAWTVGCDRVRFRGYCIEARRVDGVGEGHPLLMLTLQIVGEPWLLDRAFIAVAPYPIPGTRCDIHLMPVHTLPHWWTESPVGCVSPIDACYASPETGQISSKPCESGSEARLHRGMYRGRTGLSGRKHPRCDAQAGCLVPGGRHALFGCTKAPGFTGDCYEAAPPEVLIAQYLQQASTIRRLAVNGAALATQAGSAPRAGRPRGAWPFRRGPAPGRRGSLAAGSFNF